MKHIQCFADESSISDQRSLNMSTETFKLGDQQSSIKFLGVVPAVSSSNGQKDGFDVVAVHKDGWIRRLSADLKSQKWCLQPNTNTNSPDFEVKAGFLLGFEDARKSLLRKRQDLIALAVGDLLGTDVDDSSVLLLVSAPGGNQSSFTDVHIHILSLPALVSVDEIGISSSKHLRYLTTINLPELKGHESLTLGHAEWGFNSTSSGLSVSFESGFVNFDLSQYTPEITSHLILENERFSSIARISPRSIIGSSQSTVAIYNTQYQSVQAQLPLREIPHVGSAKKDSSKSQLHFISYFSKLGILVATQGNGLLAFDLNVHTNQNASSKRPRDGLLLNAIARGIESASQSTIGDDSLGYSKPLGLSRKVEYEQWLTIQSDLSKLAKTNSCPEFDDLVASKIIGLSIPEKNEKPSTRSSTKSYVDPEKTFFLLRNIFTLQNSEGAAQTAKLNLTFLPKKTFLWLADSNRLTIDNIKAALRGSNGQTLPDIQRGALVEALISSKRSITLLLEVLRSRADLDAFELSHALRIVLQFARSHFAGEDELPKPLTETPHETKEPTGETRGELELDGSGAILSEAIEGLNLTLMKLHSHPQDKVAFSLRSVLPNSDILSIIHHLRHSLAISGYTSRFIEANPALPSVQLSLSAIVDTLVACIDAIGPTGWISAAGFAGTDDSGATLIADMKSEISSALAGVEETTYLKGILREFIRYSETVIGRESEGRNGNKAQDQVAATPGGGKLKRKERHNGAEILIYDDYHNADAIGSDSRALPLSLKKTTAVQDGDEEVSRTKIRKATGEVKSRSNREMGYLKRKAVGKYSFEQIII